MYKPYIYGRVQDKREEARDLVSLSSSGVSAPKVAQREIDRGSAGGKILDGRVEEKRWRASLTRLVKLAVCSSSLLVHLCVQSRSTRWWLEDSATKNNSWFFCF